MNKEEVNKLNLYRMLYLNVQGVNALFSNTTIEPIQNVVFKFEESKAIALLESALNLYRMLYLNKKGTFYSSYALD